MNVPEHLQHKPIIVLNNYDEIDGIYENESDAKALSIGQAQYDPNELAVKVFRHTGEKWSRQSEELPIHRNLDMTILIIAAMLGKYDSFKPITSLKEKIINPERFKEITEYYKTNENILRPRLNEIKNLLNILL